MTKLTVGTPVTSPLTPGRDDTNIWPTHLAKYGGGGLHFAPDIASRDNLSLPRRVGATVLVDSNADGERQAFKWTGVNDDGTKADGSQGTWEPTELGTQDTFSGLTFVNADGSTTSDISVLALSGLTLSGDPTNGFTLTSDTNGGINIGTLGDDSTKTKADTLEVEWPLQAYSDPDKADTAKVSLKHGLWQLAEAPNYLAYLSDEEGILAKVRVQGGKTEEDFTFNHAKSTKGKIWPDYVICPPGNYIEIKRDDKLIGLQEADDKDPNISGGMTYYIAFVVSPLGKAPVGLGFIRPYLFDEAKDDFVMDVNGHPLGTQVNYRSGQSLKPSGNPILVTGLVNEKGLDEFSMIVEDDFPEGKIVLGDMLSGPTGIMIQAITKDSKSGSALRQFQLDTGIVLRDVIKWVDQIECSLAWGIKGYYVPATWIASTKGWPMPKRVSLFNITPAKISVEDGYLSIAATTARQEDQDKYGEPTVPCDFYVSDICDADHTNMMGGKEVRFGLTCKDSLEDMIVSLVYWDGTPDEYSVVFDTRSGGTPVLKDDWHKLTATEVSQNTVGRDVTIIGKAVLPATATNYGVIAYPKTVNHRADIEIKDLFFGAETPFTGFISKRPKYPSETAIEYHEEKGVFSQDNEKYVSLRYTLNPTNGDAQGSPLPCGELVSGALDVAVDPRVNKVAGSGATGGEGALQFSNDGKFHNYYEFKRNGQTETSHSHVFIHPGEALKKPGDVATVKLFWSKVSFDGQSFSKIPASETEIIVRYGDAPQMVVLNDFSLDLQGGDRIAFRGWCSVADGAYLISNSKTRPLVNTSVYYKRLEIKKS
ncbi:hypothetical protein KNV07_gp167 [Vibrio phage Cody]|uniref:Uncharacterized protein n=2 Tax=Thalassavirus TaxID=2948922 RepID=A0A6M9Z2C4_9CAUD|nr:hypothetical protein KNV07_gp167 [Vibrio phage Cody]YP_010108549.1 hypothetical protein KNV08_gp171 [Vibrio phage Quinn]QKN85169.1 hypothetical protein CODY_143 [Vibrio phage Cody]QKN85363.1 hypothetical protein QUINN_143 [Vibrio phage Quinn]